MSPASRAHEPAPGSSPVGGSAAPVRRLLRGLQGDPGGNRLQVMSFGCESLKDVGEQSLGLTYWFDAAPDGEPYPVTIRFTGRRVGGSGTPRLGDAFDVRATVDPVIPGSGRVSLTTRVLNITPGEWRVTATPLNLSRSRGTRPSRSASSQTRILGRATASGSTAFAPLVQTLAPGVRPGAWPALVAAGTLAALVVQALLAAHQQLPVGALLLISVSACIVGVVGAKVYYLATHRGENPNLLTVGMSLQGFVLTAVTAAALGALLAGIPIGAMLDVTAPGLLFGITIGRLGCFLGGCCAGIPTAARWGIWSSDRRVGARRIPVQLLESTMAGMLGVLALLAVTLTNLPTRGLVFVGAIAAYTFGRQVLFPLRGIPRKTRHGRTVTMLVTALTLAGTLVVAATA